MTRNSAEVQHLCRGVGLRVKVLFSESKVAEVGPSARKSAGIVTDSSVSVTYGVGAVHRRVGYSRGSELGFPSGKGSALTSFLEGYSTIAGYNRGLQSLSGELRSYHGRGTCSRLLSTSLFPASNSLSRKAVLNFRFNSLRGKRDVGGCRSYYVDKDGVQHFRRKGPAAWMEELNTQRSMVWTAGFVVIGGTIYVMNLETVPYTHRKHFVLVSPELERSVGDRGFKMVVQRRVLLILFLEVLKGRASSYIRRKGFSPRQQLQQERQAIKSLMHSDVQGVGTIFLDIHGGDLLLCILGLHCVVNSDWNSDLECHLLQEYKNRVLPPNHPETIRVHRIAGEIIEALMLGTKASDWGELERVGDDFLASGKGSGWDTVTKKRDEPLLGTYGDHTHSHDEPTDEGWVDKSRKAGLKKGEEGFTKHLEGMKWQVLVVDDDIVNAVCLPGGKIVVFTGLLKKFRSDTEIATVLAHEVGHAVARHSAESLTQNLFLVAIQLAILSVFYEPSLVTSVSELLLRLPNSRRMEIEADHIGLILMAASGYDPRLAPAFYEKLASIEKAPEHAQYLSTHPSGKRRGEKLRNTATMEEAMTIYRQRVAGRGVDGFF